MTVINDQHMQELIDELIKFLLKEIDRPDWLDKKEILDCVTYEINTCWIYTIPHIDIIERLEDEIDRLKNRTDREKISIIRDIINAVINENDGPAHYAICKVTHSDERIFYIPINCCFHEYELVFEIDSSLENIRNKYTRIQKPNIFNNNGSPLNDVQILALYEKARVNYKSYMNERH